MKKVGMMKRDYESKLLNRKENDNGKLGRNDKGLEKVTKSGTYVVRDGITNTWDAMGQVTDVRLRRNSIARFASRLVDIIELSTVKMRFVVVRAK